MEIINDPNEWKLSRQGNYHLNKLFPYEKDGKIRDITVRMMVSPIYSGWDHGKWKWDIKYRKFGMAHEYSGRENKLEDAMTKAIEISQEYVASHNKYPDLGR